MRATLEPIPACARLRRLCVKRSPARSGVDDDSKMGKKDKTRESSSATSKKHRSKHHRRSDDEDDAPTTAAAHDEGDDRMEVEDRRVDSDREDDDGEVPACPIALLLLLQGLTSGCVLVCVGLCVRCGNRWSQRGWTALRLKVHPARVVRFGACRPSVAHPFAQM